MNASGPVRSGRYCGGRGRGAPAGAEGTAPMIPDRSIAGHGP